MPSRELRRPVEVIKERSMLALLLVPLSSGPDARAFHYHAR